MDFFEKRYYNINRLLLSLLGLWPYHSLCRRLVTVTLVFLLLGTSFFLMVLRMLQEDITFALVAYYLQFEILLIDFIANLVYCFFNANKMTIMLEHIKYDWSLLQPCDTQVIEPYAEIGRLFTFWGTICTSVLAMVPLLQMSERLKLDSHSNSTNLIDLVMPPDISDAIYGKNLLYVMFVVFAISISGCLTILAPGTLYWCSMQHACGMFRIAGRRMEKMFDGLGNGTCTCKKKVVLNILHSISFHTRAIGFSDVVNSFYAPLYITEVGLFVILLSVDILHLSDAYNKIYDLGEVLISFGHFVGVLVVTGSFCYTGQILLEHSNAIFRNIYFSQWYLAPLSMQKFILIIMIRSLKESSITLTRSFTASFEMLATILQMSVSYFMTVSSLQNK